MNSYHSHRNLGIHNLFGGARISSICNAFFVPKIFAGVEYLNMSELFAMGPVQFSWPRGVAENSFTKPGFWEHFVDFS